MLLVSFLVFSFSLHHLACRILILQPGIEPVPFAVEAWMLHHWTTRGSPCSLLSFNRHHWVLGGPRGEKCQSNKCVWDGEGCGRGSEPMRTTSILGPRSFTWSAPRLREAYWETDNCDEAGGFFEHLSPFLSLQPSTSRKRLREGEAENADPTKRLAVCAAVSWTLVDHERTVPSWTLLLPFSLNMFCIVCIFIMGTAAFPQPLIHNSKCDGTRALCFLHVDQLLATWL